MSREREVITVDQDRFSVRLKTVTEEKTAKEEIFPSVEKARKNKRLMQLRETGFGFFWGTAALASTIEGIDKIVSGLDNDNLLEAGVGFQLVALATLFLRFAGKNVETVGLARRQLKILGDRQGKLNSNTIAEK